MVEEVVAQKCNVWPLNANPFVERLNGQGVLQ